MNIPIFRAKKECDGEYIEFKTYFEEDGKYRAIIKFAKQEVDGWLDSVYIPLTFRIDPSSLAIHFPDMIDSQGNKIFASLSEDGKGGDIMQDDEYFGIAKYKDCQFVVEYEDCIDNIDNGNFEVIGIQQWS